MGLPSKSAFSSKPLRVLVASQYSDPRRGGAERYFREVCSRLEKGPRLELRYLTADGFGEGGLSPGRYGFLSTTFHPAWIEEVAVVLKSVRPHVLYAHYAVPGLVSVALWHARGLGIPAGLMYHSDVTGPDPVRRTLGKLYFHLLGKRELRSCAAVFTSSLSYASASPFLRKVRCRYVTAPPGVDAAMASGRRRSMKPCLLFVGKPDVPSKGFALLKDAWKELRSRWKDLELVVVGGGERSVALKDPEEGIRNLGYIQSRQELAHWYASAAVTVLPSRSSAESFGMVLAEALVAGCPVVGSRIGGNARFVVDGKNGYTCEPNDLSSLVEALERVLREGEGLRERVRSERERYLREFSWERTAAKVEDALVEIAAGGSGQSVLNRGESQ